jgi:hypothetical protein
MVSDFMNPLDMDMDSDIRDDMVLAKSDRCGLSGIFFGLSEGIHQDNSILQQNIFM